MKTALYLFLAAIPVCRADGFDHFYNLEYEEALAIFEKEVRAKPSDAAGYNHVAQAILYREMFKAGSLESELVSGNNPFLARAKILPPEAEQRRFETAIETALRLTEGREDAPALYARGVAHGLRANYNFLIRKQWRESLREFTLSRKLHFRVVTINPLMVDAYLVEGVHDYIVGSLPFTWKLLGFLAGIRGDKDGGIRTVERVARDGDRNRVEAMILLAVAYRRERTPDRAVPLLLTLRKQYPRNYLFALELVQMYGDLGKKDEALAVLRDMASAPAAKVRYARGNLLFWYRDYAQALPDLEQAVRGGDEAGLNTVANAWLRKGQCHDMLGQRGLARNSYESSIKVAPDSDAAREARRYVNNRYRRTN